MTTASPWRLTDFRFLLFGDVVSVLGDRVLALVLGIWVKQLTGSSAQAGLVFFAYGLASIAAPLTGWLVDRFSSRTVCISAQVSGVILVAASAYQTIIIGMVGAEAVAIVLLPGALGAC